MKKIFPTFLLAIALTTSAALAEQNPAGVPAEKPKKEAAPAKPKAKAKAKPAEKKTAKPAPAQKKKQAPKPESQCVLQKEIGAIEAEVAGLSRTLDQKKAEIARSHQRHHNEIDAEKKRAAELAAKLDQAQKALAASKKENESKAAKMVELQKSIASHATAIKTAKSAHEAAVAGLTKKLDASKTLSTKALTAAGTKGKEDAAKIKTLEAQVAKMKKQCHEAHAALAQLRKSVAELGKAVSGAEVEGLPKQKAKDAKK